MTLRIYLPILMFLLLSVASCNISPQPIAYGTDGCHFCSMTIVDQLHAAQIVTKKGKTFKFDASECMMNHLKELDSNEVALFLVNDYNSPGELIDATQATYLVSQGIPSPMGEFLTAFASRQAADKALAEHQGTIYSWEQLKAKFDY